MSTLVFATGPVHLDEEGEELRERLADRLSQALGGRDVRVTAARSYGDVAAMLEDGRAQLAWLSPAVFARCEPEGVRLLAAVERSRGGGYRGVLFVPEGSPARAPSDLQGLTVAWVDEDSCSGYLIPLLSLREEGFEPSELFAAESFEGSHGSVVRAVMDGRAGVGATHAQVAPDGETLVLAGWQPYAGRDGMRPILVTAPIPADVIVAAGTLDEAEADAVRDVLLSLHEEDADLLDEVFGGPKLVPASSDDYEPVRRALE